MSMRQPTDKRQRAAASMRVKGCVGRAAPPFPSSPLPLSLMFDICHLTWPEAAEELGRALAVELRVCRLYQHEDGVGGGEREVGRVKAGGVRLGHPFQRDHAEDRE